MKKIKTIALLVTGMALFMSSCNFENVSPTSRLIDVETLDLLAFASTEDTIVNNFADTTFITNNDTTFVPYDDSTLIIYGDTTFVPYDDSTLIIYGDTTFVPNVDTTVFSVNRKIDEVKVAEIEVNALPANVIGYINSNYVEASIRRAATFDDGSFIVKIAEKNDNYIGLKFNSFGSFVSSKTPKSKSIPISVADIPANISSFIKSKYIGSTILYAIKSDKTYSVLIQKLDSKLVGVGFNANGILFAEITPKNNR